MNFMAVAAILVLAAAGSLLVSFLAARRRLAVLRDREPLSTNEIVSRYFAECGLKNEAVARHWQACAEQLGLPPGLLRPSDSFDRELRSVAWQDPFDDRKDDLVRHALALAKKRQGILDLESVRTLGDLVLALARLDQGTSDRSPA